MDRLYERIRTITYKEVSTILLCISIVYLFRAESSYNLQPTWRKMLGKEYAHNKKYHKDHERPPELPSPIITDLESDKINEIILIGADLTINVLAMPEVMASSENKALPHITIKKSVNLPVKVDVDGQVSWPVVMETGYVDAFSDSPGYVRKQIIVIVTNNWTVYCYDHSLNLLWSSQLMDIDQMDEDNGKSMGVLITAAKTVDGQQGGVVVIAGNMAHMGAQSGSAQKTSEDKRTDSFTHAYAFALSSKTGQRLWSHVPPNAHDSQSTSIPQMMKGEKLWTEFRTDLLSYLPHLWNNLRDTKLTVSRLTNKSAKNYSDLKMEDTTSTKDIIFTHLLDQEHLIGYAYGGLKPHSPHEHIKHPNSIVFHHNSGINVLNLSNGTLVTRLKLHASDTGTSVFVDIDGDSQIERLSLEPDSETFCNLVADGVYHEEMTLFKIPICKMSVFPWVWSIDADEDFQRQLPLLAIKGVTHKRSVIVHLLGHHYTQRLKAYDIIVHLSSGRVISLGPGGYIHWQIQTPISWLDIARSVKRNDASSTIKHTFINEFHPSMQHFSLQIFGKTETLAIAGWDDLILIDLRNGRLLARHSLPCQPTAPLVIGDFNNDGWNDIILTCQLGYIGFTIVQTANTVWTIVYATSVFLFILTLTWCLTNQGSDEDDQHID